MVSAEGERQPVRARINAAPARMAAGMEVRATSERRRLACPNLSRGFIESIPSTSNAAGRNEPRVSTPLRNILFYVTTLRTRKSKSSATALVRQRFQCGSADFAGMPAGDPVLALGSGAAASAWLSVYWTIREILLFEGSKGALGLRNFWSANPRTCVT